MNSSRLAILVMLTSLVACSTVRINKPLDGDRLSLPQDITVEIGRYADKHTFHVEFEERDISHHFNIEDATGVVTAAAPDYCDGVSSDSEVTIVAKANFLEDKPIFKFLRRKTHHSIQVVTPVIELENLESTASGERFDLVVGQRPYPLAVTIFPFDLQVGVNGNSMGQQSVIQIPPDEVQSTVSLQYDTSRPLDSGVIITAPCYQQLRRVL